MKNLTKLQRNIGNKYKLLTSCFTTFLFILLKNEQSQMSLNSIELKNIKVLRYIYIKICYMKNMATNISKKKRKIFLKGKKCWYIFLSFCRR